MSTPDGNISMKALLLEGGQILCEAGVPDAKTDAWLLLQHVTGVSRAHYYAYPEEIPEQGQVLAYRDAIRKRARRIPLQHIIGSAWFMGEEYEVNPGVLIPRHDTETLSEEALRFLKETESPKILDLCTGSGCILISLLLGIPSAKGIGTDLSENALMTAKRNAAARGVSDRADFLCGDLFDALSEKAGNLSESRPDLPEDGGNALFDMIVSNPPYIPTVEIDGLMDEVRLHDPRIALDGGEDGLCFYRRITREAASRLKKGGMLLLETGKGQGDAVAGMMRGNGFQNVRIINDLSGIDRVVTGILPSETTEAGGDYV